MIELRGITWDHPRGRDPMLATAAAFAKTHPGVRISWAARSLQAFGDEPVEQLAQEYDLLVIDHPFAGVAARTGCLLPLDEHLPAGVLRDLAQHSVGASHASYHYGGHQWALAIDAAAQVSAYRPDLLAQRGLAVPRTWEQVREMTVAATGARVAIPLSAVNAICSFLSLCASHGEPAGRESDRLVRRVTGIRALAILRHLVAHGHPASLDLDPPHLLDRMAGTDEILYCPLLFGYSNYSRPGYAPHLCRFTNIPTPGPDGPPRGAVLGGTGLAVSAHCRAIPEACAYAQWVAGSECQRTLYLQSGGQPAHRLAWVDRECNAATNDFFRDTLDTLDHAYLRPRHDGFITFQDRAGPALHHYLRHGGSDRAILAHLDALYIQTLPEGVLPPDAQQRGRRSAPVATERGHRRDSEAAAAPVRISDKDSCATRRY